MELKLPIRKPPGAESFDVRPAHIEDWIAGLPMANAGEVTRQVYNALQDVNGLEVNRQHRFKMLEACRLALEEINDPIKKHFVHKPFPLSETSRKVANVARELLHEMALGYEIYAQEELDEGGLLKDNKQVAIALARALGYLGEALLCTYQIYAPLPKGVWQEIHHLYAFALHHELTRQNTRGSHGGVRDAASINDAYQHILLLSLACPYRLRQGEVEQVDDALHEWAPHCRLGKPDDPSLSKAYFMLDLESDDPPAYRNLKPLTDSTLLLDTSQLAEDIRAALGKLHSSTDTPALGSQGLSVGVLRRLMLSWGVMPKRKFSRTRQQTSIQMATGLSAAHYFISGEKGLDVHSMQADSDKGTEPGFDTRAHFNADEVMTDHGRVPDLWELSIDDGETELAPRSEQNTPAAASPRAKTSYQAVDWQMIDISAGGCCLYWDSADTTPALVGELVALRNQREPDEFHWALGVIRWMKQVNHQGLMLGIQLLSPGAIAVGTRVANGNNQWSEYMRSLLLPAIHSIAQPATLITPTLPYRTGSKVELNRHGQSSSLVLGRMLENTGGFAQFHFSGAAHREDVTNDPAGTEDTIPSMWTER